MSQKEDILEQIVEEYLRHQGYFVQRNIKYRPDRAAEGYVASKDSVHSDIDVLAINPTVKGARRVLVFNIKSYQGGFDFSKSYEQVEGNKKFAGRDAQLKFRELCIPKWSNAFVEAVEMRTGDRRFTYVFAVTRAKGNLSLWTRNKKFTQALKGNAIEVLTLKEMVETIEPQLTTTPAATDIGRTLQLFRAAGLRPKPAKPLAGVGPAEEDADDLGE